MSFEKTPEQSEACKLLTSANYTRILLRSGARAGKTFIIIRWMILRMIQAPGSRHIVLRDHFNTVKLSVWHETIPAVLKLCFPELQVSFNKSSYYFELADSELWIGGLDDKERVEKILGREYVTIFFNEISQIPYPSIKLALSRLSQKVLLENGQTMIPKAIYDCNPPSKKHWSYKLWFEHIDPDTNDRIKYPELYASMKLNPYSNIKNLADNYIQQTLENYTGRDRTRFLEGEYQDEIEGTLWNDDSINNFRVIEPPTIRRIIIAVDPAVSTTKDSDETGIVAAGMGTDGHYYIMADRSGSYTPYGWGKVVVDLFHELKADRVVAEVNQGGDLVESNIRNIDRSITVKKVHANRGKLLRAEPIAALYEKGTVHHVGIHKGLEDQMTSWKPLEDSGSPDRVDALVYAVTELSTKIIYGPPGTKVGRNPNM